MTKDEKKVVKELVERLEEIIDYAQCMADAHPDTWYEWWLSINKGRVLIGKKPEDLSYSKEEAEKAIAADEEMRKRWDEIFKKAP